MAGSRGPGPLEEMSHNERYDYGRQDRHKLDSSPSKKNGFSAYENGSPAHSQTVASGSPTKKTRNRTNLAGFLSRPKSIISMQKFSAKEEQPAFRAQDGDRPGKHTSPVKDKENRVPSDRFGNLPAVPTQNLPPIYMQFCDRSSQNIERALPSPRRFPDAATAASAMAGGMAVSPGDRPTGAPAQRSDRSHARPKSCVISDNGHSVASSASSRQSDMEMDPASIATHLEALLDRRNIPENQRYKMRNLTSTIKLELIRQDWAEERAKQNPQEGANRHHTQTHSNKDVTGRGASTLHSPPTAAIPAPSADSGSVDSTSPAKMSKSKHSRVKSLTLSRMTQGRNRDRSDGKASSGRDQSLDRDGGGGSNNNSNGSRSSGKANVATSPVKKRTGATLGRHLRSKSTESFVLAWKGQIGGKAGEPSTSNEVASDSSFHAGILSRVKTRQHTPGDFVNYVRATQKPEQVEVGKLHKLRLLLRNETVAWTEDFIGQGGMEETVGLLYRIMAIEWREEHEDALLHETLLCLKALCTTALALEYLHAIHATLLPALIHMIFDPEKKGPSEFTTRNIITSILFTYIQSAPTQQRFGRAKTVLGYLRDPVPKEDDRPVSFVLDMHKERPYRVWCKEVVSVTKEVFWIFLHNLNVVSLPATSRADATAPGIDGEPAVVAPAAAADDYMIRHFPGERPPVPAAPYVGGVEWEATNYLASHLELLNAILSCTPTASERNNLRFQMRISGWERCMGGSLRLCKEKFYGAVHDGLRTWVAAAHEDGWDVRDVRYGLPPPSSAAVTEVQVSPKRKSKLPDPAPKIDIPKLEFVLDGEAF